MLENIHIVDRLHFTGVIHVDLVSDKLYGTPGQVLIELKRCAIITHYKPPICYHTGNDELPKVKVEFQNG